MCREVVEHCIVSDPNCRERGQRRMTSHLPSVQRTNESTSQCAAGHISLSSSQRLPYIAKVEPVIRGSVATSF